MKVEESLNVRFDKSPPPLKTSPLVDDEVIKSQIIENQVKQIENEENRPLNNQIVNIKESINHPLDKVIGILNERTLRSQAHNQSSFFCIVSSVEPKNINKDMKDECWIMAMQEELNQFVANDVWNIVPPPTNQTVIAVMSSSTVTYTSIYSDSELGRVFWGADEKPSDGGLPRVIVYGYDGLLMLPVALTSPDYVPGPEHPPSPDYVPGPEHPPSPVDVPYVSKPKYPEYLATSDAEAPLEDQSLPADEDHTDYPADGGDGDYEPFDDDDDDDDTDDEDEEPFEDEDDDEEEEEHLASADSSAIPIIDPVPSAGDTEAFETDESAPTPRSPQTKVLFAQTRLRRARKTVRLEPRMSLSMEARIAEHAAALTPPLPVASPPLPLPSPLTTSPTDAGAPLGYRAAGIRIRAASPPLLLPSTSHRTDILEAEMPP
ncbi:hypothetical protein Tco_0190817 [Tanacetum coccineum]